MRIFESALFGTCGHGILVRLARRRVAAPRQHAKVRCPPT
jgi:hypothetical protein